MRFSRISLINMSQIELRYFLLQHNYFFETMATNRFIVTVEGPQGQIFVLYNDYQGRGCLEMQNIVDYHQLFGNFRTMELNLGPAKLQDLFNMGEILTCNQYIGGIYIKNLSDDIIFEKYPFDG